MGWKKLDNKNPLGDTFLSEYIKALDAAIRVIQVHTKILKDKQKTLEKLGGVEK